MLVLNNFHLCQFQLPLVTPSFLHQSVSFSQLLSDECFCCSSWLLTALCTSAFHLLFPLFFSMLAFPIAAGSLVSMKPSLSKHYCLLLWSTLCLIHLSWISALVRLFTTCFFLFYSWPHNFSAVAQSQGTKNKEVKKKKFKESTPPSEDWSKVSRPCSAAFHLAVLMASSINLLPATQCCLAEAFF